MNSGINFNLRDHWFSFHCRILRILDTGLMTYWQKRWSPDNPHCSDVSGDQKGHGGTVTSLKDIQSAFYLSVIGLGIAAVTLGVEFLLSLISAAGYAL